MYADGDAFEGQSEVAGIYETPFLARKSRRRNLEEDYDDELKDNMREYLIVRQKLETENVELNREKIILERELLSAEKERMNA